jgi:hypothetical protein
MAAVLLLLALSAASPDNRFQASFDNDRLVIADRAGAVLRRIPIEPRITRSIDNVFWIDNRIVGVEGGINPSIAQLRRFDAFTGRELKDLVGLRFTPCIAAGQVAHTAWVPHFTDNLEAHSQHVQVDGRDVYDSRHEGEVHTIEAFFWSEDCSALAFIDEEENGDSETLIVLRGGRVVLRSQLPPEHHSARVTRIGRDAVDLLSPAGELHIAFPVAPAR